MLTYLTNLTCYKGNDMDINKAELIELINAVMDARDNIKKSPMGKLESDSLDKLAPALCKMQGEFTTVIPTKTNPRFKSKYADYDDIVKMARPHLAANGFSLHSKEEEHDGVRYIRTKLLHSSEQYISSFVRVIEDKNNKTDIQAYGSGVSYHKRYSVQSILGISINDDVIENDGNPPEETNATNKQNNKKHFHKTTHQTQNKQKQTLRGNYKPSKPKPPAGVPLLSKGEIEFINDELNGHSDIRHSLMTEVLEDIALEECPKAAFNHIVSYIDKQKSKKNT